MRERERDGERKSEGERGGREKGSNGEREGGLINDGGMHGKEVC